jgi:hypothetical protein
MTDHLPFRQAVPADAPALFEAHRDSVLHLCTGAYSPRQMASWFEGRTHEIYGQALVEGKVWLAERVGRVMGCLFGRKLPALAWAAVCWRWAWPVRSRVSTGH